MKRIPRTHYTALCQITLITVIESLLLILQTTTKWPIHILNLLTANPLLKEVSFKTSILESIKKHYDVITDCYWTVNRSQSSYTILCQSSIFLLKITDSYSYRTSSHAETSININFKRLQPYSAES